MAQSDWIDTHCRRCGSRTAIHKDWKNPDPDCGICRLVSGNFVDAIEILLISKYSNIPDAEKDRIRDMIEAANRIYNENLRKLVERTVAWRIAERELAYRVWNDKELRKSVLSAIKALRKYEKEDAKAELRNEQRAARTADGTRRWTG